jgi:energy-coupling factor transporter ATP-binding protein EcfA2
MLCFISNREPQCNEYFSPFLLSPDEKKIVSLAVSLIHSPQLVLLDEPTFGLDPVLRERCIGAWRDIRFEIMNFLFNLRVIVLLIRFVYLMQFIKYFLVSGARS